MTKHCGVTTRTKHLKAPPLRANRSAVVHLQNDQLAWNAVTPLDQEETRVPFGGFHRINKSSVELAGGLNPCRTRSGNLYFYVVPVAVTRAHIHGGACATVGPSSLLLSSFSTSFTSTSSHFSFFSRHPITTCVTFCSFRSSASYRAARDSRPRGATRTSPFEPLSQLYSLAATLARMNDEWCAASDTIE